MARKKIKLSDDVAAAVPLSSMIDIVFLLLIYFIFTQKPVVEDVYLQLDLPTPSPPTNSNETPPPILRIDVVKTLLDNDDWVSAELKKAKTQAEVNAILDKEQVYYYVNTSGDASGTPMSVKDLENYLKSIAEASPDTTIVLSCGPNAKHKKLIRILDICSKLQLTHLNLLNDATVAFKADPPEKRD